MKHLLFISGALLFVSAHATIEDESEHLLDHQLEVSEESGTIISDKEVGIDFKIPGEG